MNIPLDDLKDVYDNFLTDLSTVFGGGGDGISDFVKSPEFKICQIHKDTVSSFVTRLNHIFTKIFEKKRMKMTDIKSMSVFIDIMKSCGKSISNNILNLYNSPNLNSSDIVAILSQVVDSSDTKLIKEFHNYILLIYMHSCMVLYPSVSSDCLDPDIPKDCVENFQEALKFFESTSYTGTTLGETMIQIAKDALPLMMGKYGRKDKIEAFLCKSDLPTFINELCECFADSEHFVTFNEELKQVNKQDVVSSCTDITENVDKLIGMDLFDKNTLDMVAKMVSSNDGGSLNPDMMGSVISKIQNLLL